MTDPLHRQQLRQALDLGGPLPEALRQRILDALDAADRELSLDRGFGLSPSWWRADARRRRDALITAAYRMLPAGLSLRKAAEAIITTARTLGSGRAHTPRRGPAKAVELAIATGSAFPTSARQIQNVLRPTAASVKSGQVEISQ